jgi:hypothetical protein
MKKKLSHLFFGCVVAEQAWLMLSEVVGFNMGIDFESMAKCWLCNTKYEVANVLSSAMCWGIWKLRNSLGFQGVQWRSMKQLWSMVIPMLRCCRVLIPLKIAAGIELLEKMNSRPMQLAAPLGMTMPDLISG